VAAYPQDCNTIPRPCPRCGKAEHTRWDDDELPPPPVVEVDGYAYIELSTVLDALDDRVAHMRGDDLPLGNFRRRVEELRTERIASGRLAEVAA
jgi:hypothetical protein